MLPFRYLYIRFRFQFLFSFFFLVKPTSFSRSLSHLDIICSRSLSPNCFLVQNNISLYLALPLVPRIPEYAFSLTACTQHTVAKGRTNIELREQFILADGVSQTMTAFRSKPSPTSTLQRTQMSSTNAGPITKVSRVPLFSRGIPQTRHNSFGLFLTIL